MKILEVIGWSIITMLINEGFIRSYDQLINYLRKKWQEKYQPKVLQS